MVTVNSFFCFRLHTAGIVLGWLGAGLSLLNVITFSIILGRIDDFLKNFENKDSNIDIHDNERNTAIIIVAIYLTINIIDCVASVLLIVGTVKEKHLLLVPWLFNCGFSLIFNIINSLGSVVLIIVNGINFAAVVLVLIIATVVIGVQLMAWLAMYSLFKLIRMSTEQQRLLPDKSASGIPSYTRI